ncbi:MAG TPA: glycosyltransferase family 4 protein [Gemmatimonadaceae bacterium]|nr:glycosyltransferase family 4 protein [Gemmatimonadaceae bacterium]
MKILYLCADRGITLAKHNGATAHFRSLVHAFQSAGHEVVVLTPSDVDSGRLGASVVRIPTPPVLDDLLRSAQAMAAPSREAQRTRKRVAHAVGQLLNNVLAEDELEREIERFNPDFVFELYSPFGVAGVFACNRLGVPHVLNVHAPLAWEGATFRSQALQEAAETLEEVVMHEAQRIITNSAQMRDRLVDAGVDEAKVEVVVNGVDLDLFSPVGEVKRAGDHSSVVIGFSGSLKAWHGIDVLTAAFRKAAAADPRLHLLVVGDGPLRGEVTCLAAELPGRVTHTGALPLEDVPPWIRGMDIAVAPYPPIDRFYFSPLKILDAMACGVCNVASDIGQIPELLRDGETGVLVRPGDADALAAAFLATAGDPAMRQRIGEAGLAEARENHAWTSRVADIVSIAMRDVPVGAA